MVKRALAFLLLISAALPCFGQAGNSSIVRFGGDGRDGLVQKGNVAESIPLQINSRTFAQLPATTYQPKSGSVVNCRTSMSLNGATHVVAGGLGASPAGANSTAATGGAGGGSLTILSLGQIQIGAAGSLTVVGRVGGAGLAGNDPGAQGGAGGILKLASRDKIVNLGTISAAGGAGGASAGTADNSAGGNGGFVVLIAPRVVQGTVSVAGGVAGAGGSGAAGAAGAAGQVVVCETVPQLPLLAQLDNPEVVARLAAAQSKKHGYLSESEIFTIAAGDDLYLLSELQMNAPTGVDCPICSK